MPLSPSHKEEMLAATRMAAAALLEDMQYIREVVERSEPSRGELRRLSGTLRRLLIYRDLQ